MNLYLYRLIPPRPTTFASTMTPQEAAVLREHVEYWGKRAAEGRVLVFGPVADPDGAFGIAVIVAEEGVDPSCVYEKDPAITANSGFSFKIHLMPRFALGSVVVLPASTMVDDST